MDKNELRANLWYMPQEFFKVNQESIELLKCLELTYSNGQYFCNNGYGKLFFLAKDNVSKSLCWVNDSGQRINDYCSGILNMVFHRGLRNKTIENESCDCYKHFKCYLKNPFPDELLKENS